ncbi:hypothetical protein BGZ96_008023 [Linnemannia gamsii]|uniref:Uncharacterized protein n=1 Tax=Linnemannia gamsii TaxID=64522 RepID=A0ABQ7KDC5_9FUNG|nr:hypothetical protein BGZ96_008023 [Linnemannia gamsii]
MLKSVEYAPSGTVEEIQTTLWTVDTKQPFPIQGPFYDIAGYLFKPTLKRLSPNGPLDLEIELMSPVSARTPLQVGIAIETRAPPGEKNLTHSFQRRSAALSDVNPALEFKTVMMHDRWENSKGLRIEFKFDSIQRQKPRYDWLWNSQSTNDVEIRFQDPLVTPILVHKELILEACPDFINLVRVVSSTNDAASNDGASGARAQDQVDTSPSTRSSRPGSPTPTPSPAMTPHTSSTEVEQRQQKVLQWSGREPDLMSMDEGSDISSSYRSMTSSFIHVSRDPSEYSSSKGDMPMTGSDRNQHQSPTHPEDILLEEADAGERRPLLLQIHGGNGGSQHQDQQHNQSSNDGIDSDQLQQQEYPHLSRNKKKDKKKEKKELDRQQQVAAAASGNTSSSEVTNPTGEDDERERMMKIFMQEQEAKRQARQQEREKDPHSPLMHIFPGSKTPPLPVFHQHQVRQLQLGLPPSPQTSAPDKSVSTRPEREIWQWPAELHADVCTILIRWIYLEEVPSHSSGCSYTLNVIEILLDTCYRLNLQILFQRFLTTQLFLIEQHQNPMFFWKSFELTKQGGMVYRFFRPIIVKTSAQNLQKIVWSQEFGDILGSEDPSGIFREALAAQPSSLSRQ